MVTCQLPKKELLNKVFFFAKKYFIFLASILLVVCILLYKSPIDDNESEIVSLYHKKEVESYDVDVDVDLFSIKKGNDIELGHMLKSNVAEHKKPTLKEVKADFLGGDSSKAVQYVRYNRECFIINGFEDKDVFLSEYSFFSDMDYDKAEKLYDNCSEGVMNYEDVHLALYERLEESKDNNYLLALIEHVPNNFNERNVLLSKAIKDGVDVDRYLAELFNFPVEVDSYSYLYAKLLKRKEDSLPPTQIEHIEANIFQFESDFNHDNEQLLIDELISLLLNSDEGYRNRVDEIYEIIFSM